MSKLIFKKIITIVLCLSMLIALCGCNIAIPETASISVLDAFSKRVDNNKYIAEKLCKSGLISESEKESVNKSLDSSFNEIKDKLNKGEDISKLISDAIVDWRIVENNSETNPNQDGDFDSQYITNWLNSNYGSKLDFAITKSGGKVEPIKLINKEAAEMLNNKLNYPMYVINENVELDKLNQAVTEATAGTQVDVTKLNNYFHALVDSNNKPVTLLDVSQRENQIVQDSVGSPLVDENNKVINPDANILSNTKLHGTYDANNVPGKDMVLVQREQPVLAMRFTEFNEDALEKIINTLGLNEQEYLLTGSGSDARVYVLQYPVGYIKGFKLDDKDSSKFEPIISKSNLSINIKTGKMAKQNPNGTPGEVDANNAYIYLNGGKPDSSSFVINGVTGVSTNNQDPNNEAWDLKFGATNTPVSISRIVLRDYLELSYSPDVKDKYKLVSYGRKFRIDKLNGNIEEPIGWYCDSTGNKPASPNNIYITDICDCQAITRDNPYIKSLPDKSGEKVSTDADEKTLISEIDGNSGYDKSKTDNLKKIKMSKIECGTSFPGGLVNNEDYSLSDTKQLFYGMPIDTNFSTSGLINWITSKDKNNSLAWWNDWLNTHKFKYKLDSNSLSAYLKDNYTYELNENGTIILDLTTLTKIQSEFDNENKIQFSHAMRTTFKVFGYALVCYSLILMSCWVLDTSLDLGFGILQKLSFGKLIAVTSEEEVPDDGIKGAKYVDFNSIFKISLELMALGLILIIVDIVSLVYGMVKSFGSIAKLIGKIIGG